MWDRDKRFMHAVSGFVLGVSIYIFIGIMNQIISYFDYPLWLIGLMIAVFVTAIIFLVSYLAK